MDRQDKSIGDKILITEYLRNLASNFQTKLPQVVSLGAKKSEKISTYIQISKFQYWENFLYVVLNKEFAGTTYIFPFLQPRNLQNNAQEILENNREVTRKDLGVLSPKFSTFDYEMRIEKSLKENLTEREWSNFWFNEIARSLGIVVDDKSVISLQEINSYLENKKTRIVCLFGGLEDIFQADFNENQQYALRALLDLPNKLSEIRQVNLGVIIFLNRNFLEKVITQNAAQFESLYSPYDLSD